MRSWLPCDHELITKPTPAARAGDTSAAVKAAASLPSDDGGANMAAYLLKDDAEILSKVFKISFAADPTPTSPPLSARGSSPSGGGDAPVIMADLAEELKTEAGEKTSPEDIAAKYADLGERRSLFDARSSAASPRRPTRPSSTSCRAALRG